MRKLLTILIIGIFPVSLFGGSNADRQTNEFTTQNGMRAVRSVTPGEGLPQMLSQTRPPIRNPHIMADVRWVDRNSENAIAEDVTTTPDGSGIFVGWWLNNMRFAAYASAGTEFPVWRYNQNTPWTMPVAAGNSRFAGSGNGFPTYVWDKDSPLFTDQIDLGPNYNGGGVAFSGDGSLVASAFAVGSTDAVLVLYDMASHDTLFTRTFDQARGLQGVDLSRDGTVAVVTCYDWVYVFDVPSGAPRDTIYNYSQVTAKTSADGSLITLGFYTGRLYLYYWDGSQYRQRWIVNTFHDWVTAVDISDDGSTVACGTLDFVNNQVAGGKFEMLDAATGDTLITYYDYGDMVSSVALSADGRYAIAGSWGTYHQTFGDVVTCFYRESSVPIFQLLDDVDEPGSIFGVAISDSGHYAAAGGKAVHARDFGNGGMLYSIQVRDPLTNDVAVSSIDQPGEFLAPGESVAPTATFINVGNSIASFTASCTVTNLENNQEIYNSSVYLSDVMPFFTSQAPGGHQQVLHSAGDRDLLETRRLFGCANSHER